MFDAAGGAASPHATVYTTDAEAPRSAFPSALHWKPRLVYDWLAPGAKGTGLAIVGDPRVYPKDPRPATDAGCQITVPDVASVHEATNGLEPVFVTAWLL